MDLFKNSKLSYEGSESNLTREQITELFNNDFLTLHEDFIRLYLTYDGIQFSEQAMMMIAKFYDVPKGEPVYVGLGLFLDLDDIIKARELTMEYNPELIPFVQTHIPFADDGCGNEVWIEISTGLIKATKHEEELEEGLQIVAPNFKDFCSEIENFDSDWYKR